eukprot:457844_1
MSQSLSRKQKKHATPHSIPISIIDLCLLYYEEIIYWDFKKGLYPNGSEWASDTSKGSILFGCSFYYIDPQIKSIIANVILECKETETKLIGTICNSEKTNDYIFKSKGFRNNTLYLKNCTHLSSLTFSAYIDILHLSFKTNNEIHTDFIYTKSIKVNQISKLKWDITNEILNKCKSLPIGHHLYCKSYDNNNWYLFIEMKENTLLFCVQLFRLPYGIGKIDVQINVKNDDNFIANDVVMDFDLYKNDQLGFYSMESMDKVKPFTL